MAAAPGDNRLRRRGRHLRSGHECLKMAPVATSEIKKLVLAYSGGLDTSVILRWARDFYHCEVVAYCADVGQAEETLGLEQKALATGASKLYLEDLREEFARDFVFPMMRANAVYESYYLLGTSIARPVIAKRQVEIARAEGADAVGHGATGKGNDQVRFEFTFARLAPELKVVAPWRHPQWPFRGRADMLAYAAEKKIPVPVTAEKPYSMDRNLVHVSYEGGILEDPWREPYDDMFRLTASPQSAPDTPEYVEVEYAGGDPIAINGKRFSPAALIEHANTIAGRHGVGRVDLVENRYVGIKSRGVYESPGATMLLHAHRAVEQLALDRETLHLRDSLVPRYAEIVYNGYWFAPERDAMQALIDHAQRERDGRCAPETFQGGSVDRRAQVAQFALRHLARELRRGRRLPAGRRRRFHPVELDAPARARAPRPSQTRGQPLDGTRRHGQSDSVQALASNAAAGPASGPEMRQVQSQNGRPHHASQRRDKLRGAWMLLPHRRPALSAARPLVQILPLRQRRVSFERLKNCPQ